jgi:protein-(glutamine-N5) methyltransferase, release factor-specific
MMLQSLRKELKARLKAIGDLNGSKEVDLILTQILNLDKSTLLFGDLFISDVVIKKIKAQIERIAHGEPLAHVMGKTTFFGATFIITKDVLIPRQETEILAELVAKEIERKNLEEKVLWDICTGSGCLGISLKKLFPTLRVVLSDMSDKALKIAKENATLNGVEVEIRQGDLFAPFTGEKADIIISNPPYISPEEYETLDPSVKDYDPKMALVAEDEGLYFYKQFATKSPYFLNPHGLLWLEIGYNQGAKVKEIFKNCKILKDLSGHDRFLRAELS